MYVDERRFPLERKVEKDFFTLGKGKEMPVI